MTAAVGWWTIAVALLIAPGARGAIGRIRPPAQVSGRPAGVHRVANDPLAVAATFDLMAACLRAGLPMAEVAAAVAALAPAALREPLRRAADRMVLGSDPVVAWQEVAANPATEALARMARRSARSGTSLAAGIAELAEQHRASAEDDAVARAERAGVLISGPLGLCFLPAFVCLGIVPVVIGLAGNVLGGGLL